MDNKKVSLFNFLKPPVQEPAHPPERPRPPRQELPDGVKETLNALIERVGKLERVLVEAGERSSKNAAAAAAGGQDIRDRLGSVERSCSGMVTQARFSAGLAEMRTAIEGGLRSEFDGRVSGFFERIEELEAIFKKYACRMPTELDSKSAVKTKLSAIEAGISACGKKLRSESAHGLSEVELEKAVSEYLDLSNRLTKIYCKLHLYGVDPLAVNAEVDCLKARYEALDRRICGY